LRPPQAVAFEDEHWVQAPASEPVRWQTDRVGSGQLGAPSDVQPTHACVAGEQNGVMPPQSASPRQPTQLPPPAAVSHSGTEAVQREVSVGVQVAHTPLARQRGAAVPHSALEPQPRHDDVERSQMGVAPVHAAVAPAAHSTQLPAGEHTGALAGQSAAAQARHACVAASQTGVTPPQSAAERHPTHVPAPVSQRAVAPVQAPAFVTEQAPHAPPGWQAGVEPAQSPSPSQTRQLCAVGSQTGFADGHCASSRHETQSPVMASQRGVAPAQVAAFIAEHWPQAPFGWQAGAELPHWASAEQP
jgi:hypothetical protein